MYNINDLIDVLTDDTVDTLTFNCSNLFFEGAVKRSKKEKLDRYFKKYGYQGDAKSGTITVDGSEYKVIRKQPSTKAMTNNKRENVIEIDDEEFASIKNNKRRDAVLQHEIGHLKHHKPTDPNSSFKRKNTIQKNSMYEGMRDGGYDVDSKSVENQVKTAATVSTAASYITSPPKKKDRETKEKNKVRDENLEKYEKYENRGTHANATEFEADAYASQHKNGDHIQKALRDIHKHAKKDSNTINKKVTKELEYRKSQNPDSKVSFEGLKKEYITSLNKGMVSDIQRRAKAAKDTTIDKSVYKDAEKKTVTTESCTINDINIILNI